MLHKITYVESEFLPEVIEITGSFYKFANGIRTEKPLFNMNFDEDWFQEKFDEWDIQLETNLCVYYRTDIHGDMKMTFGKEDENAEYVELIVENRITSVKFCEVVKI